MNCISCGTEISPSFKHAFAQNVCPACGGPIIDEESLALIEDVGATLSSEAALRADTAHKLAVALVTRYDIQLRGSQPAVVRQASRQQRPAAPAQPSHTQKLIQEAQGVQEPNIVSPEELQKMAEQGISEAEKEAMMADAVSRKYNLVDQFVSEGTKNNGIFIPEDDDLPALQGQPFSEGAEVPILEKERLLRLQKQQQAMHGGGGRGSFRRSS